MAKTLLSKCNLFIKQFYHSRTSDNAKCFAGIQNFFAKVISLIFTHDIK